MNDAGRNDAGRNGSDASREGPTPAPLRDLLRQGAAYGVALLCGALVAAGVLAWLTGPAAWADDPGAAGPAVAVPSPDSGAAAETFGPPAPPDRIGVLRGSIERGQTLHATLTRLGVPGSTVLDIASAMRPVFDFRYARAGHRFRLARRPDGSVVEFEYRTSPTEGYRLRRVGDALEAERIQVELVPRVEKLAGVITTSIYNAVRNLGESGQLAHDFANLFAWDVDFNRDVRPGDEFRMVYERLYHREANGDEVYVRPGRILAAQYRGREVHSAVYYEGDEGPSGHYRLDGSAVERQFLRAPLRYSRISSHYTYSRFHPILKVRRPHLGIDYAAPTGTPVWSVADGVVVFRGRSGGFGNLVKVRHPNGYVSYYGHLHRFAPDLRVGSTVEQKQVIGYVGSTGLSTGPHVDFRIRKDDRYVNPATLRTPPGDPIPPEQKPEFFAVRDALLAELDPTPVASLGEAL